MADPRIKPIWISRFGAAYLCPFSDQTNRLHLEFTPELPALHARPRLHEIPNLGVHETGSSPDR